MNEPLVTVITVTYNSARYVKDAIESVLALTYPNIEYIIGDDCSKDNTWEIIGAYKDPRIKAYRNPTNIGEYPNRNKALGLATGKYLLFIDGDDMVYPHGVSYFVDLMEKFPEAAVAIQKNYLNNVVFPVLLSPAEALTNQFFGHTSLISSSLASNFFRTDRLKATGGFSGKFRSGDEEIRLKLACTDPFLLVQGWVTWPRETPGSASVKIHRLDGLSEMYHIVLDLQDTGLLHRAGAGLADLIVRYMRNILRNEILRSLLKGDLRTARSLKKKNNFTWKDLCTPTRKYGYPHDFLVTATPVNPFKQKF